MSGPGLFGGTQVPREYTIDLTNTVAFNTAAPKSHGFAQASRIFGDIAGADRSASTELATRGLSANTAITSPPLSFDAGLNPPLYLASDSVSTRISEYRRQNPGADDQRVRQLIGLGLSRPEAQGLVNGTLRHLAGNGSIATDAVGAALNSLVPQAQSPLVQAVAAAEQALRVNFYSDDAAQGVLSSALEGLAERGSQGEVINALNLTIAVKRVIQDETGNVAGARPLPPLQVLQAGSIYSGPLVSKKDLSKLLENMNSVDMDVAFFNEHKLLGLLRLVNYSGLSSSDALYLSAENYSQTGGTPFSFNTLGLQESEIVPAQRQFINKLTQQYINKGANRMQVSLRHPEVGAAQALGSISPEQVEATQAEIRQDFARFGVRVLVNYQERPEYLPVVRAMPSAFWQDVITHSTNDQLRTLNLTGINLRGADLQEVNLSGLDFSGSNLRNANLSAADLTGTQFREANMEGANLGGATLDITNMFRAQLADANLMNTTIVGSIFQQADLSRVNFGGATFGPEVNMESAVLTGVYLSPGQLGVLALLPYQLSQLDIQQDGGEGGDLLGGGSAPTPTRPSGGGGNSGGSNEATPDSQSVRESKSPDSPNVSNSENPDATQSLVAKSATLPKRGGDGSGGSSGGNRTNAATVQTRETWARLNQKAKAGEEETVPQRAGLPRFFNELEAADVEFALPSTPKDEDLRIDVAKQFNTLVQDINAENANALQQLNAPEATQRRARFEGLTNAFVATKPILKPLADLVGWWVGQIGSWLNKWSRP